MKGVKGGDKKTNKGDGDRQRSRGGRERQIDRQRSRVRQTLRKLGKQKCLCCQYYTMFPRVSVLILKRMKVNRITSAASESQLI